MHTAVDAINRAARYQFDIVVNDEDGWIAVPRSVPNWSGVRIRYSFIYALLFNQRRSMGTSFLTGDLSSVEVEYVAGRVMEVANQHYWKQKRLRRRGTQRGGWR